MTLTTVLRQSGGLVLVLIAVIADDATLDTLGSSIEINGDDSIAIRRCSQHGEF